MSDVGLAKACRAAKHSHPAPPLVGQVQHGKSLPPKPPLPDRPNHPDQVVIASGGRRRRTGRASAQPALETERWEAAQAVRKKSAAFREAQDALRQRLLAQTERRGQAEAIRAYIAAADRSPAAAIEDYAGWRAWALEDADAMDPLKDGSAPFARLPPIEAEDGRGG